MYPVLLIHIFSAALRSATAWNLVVLDVKLVVVRQLFTGHDASQGEDDDVLLTENIDDL